MATSGYYDEIAEVEALRRQQRWRFRRRYAVHSAQRLIKRTKRGSNAAASTSLRKRSAI